MYEMYTLQQLGIHCVLYAPRRIYTRHTFLLVLVVVLVLVGGLGGQGARLHLLLQLLQFALVSLETKGRIDKVVNERVVRYQQAEGQAGVQQTPNTHTFIISMSL